MQVRLRLIDYTPKDPVEIGSFTNMKQLEAAAYEYIDKTEGHCQYLITEEYDNKRGVYIPLTASTMTMNSLISSYRDKYLKTIREGEKLWL